jgi:hypothetical protein
MEMTEAYRDIIEWPSDLQPAVNDYRQVLTSGYASAEESDDETPGSRRTGTRVPGQRTQVRVREPAGGRTDEVRFFFGFFFTITLNSLACFYFV